MDKSFKSEIVPSARSRVLALIKGEPKWVPWSWTTYKMSAIIQPFGVAGTPSLYFIRQGTATELPTICPQD